MMKSRTKSLVLRVLLLKVTHFVVSQAAISSLKTVARSTTTPPSPYKPLAAYTPNTSVFDSSLVDQDIKIMVDLFSNNTAESFALALKVYQQGAFNMPYAILTLDRALTEDVKVGVHVTGHTQDSDFINGTIRNKALAGTKTLYISYGTGVEEIAEGCHVANNPNPILKGCFAENGVLYIDGIEKPQQYLYKPLLDNYNDRSLQSLSLNAAFKMKPCNICEFFLMFRRYVYYYDKPDFANDIIMAAFNGSAVSFAHSTEDFTALDMSARADSIVAASAYLIVMPYVVRELEQSMVKCETPCLTDACTLDVLHSMETSLSLYIGSLEGEEGKGQGYLMYSLADEMCTYFRTCGPNGNSASGTSLVNTQVIAEYEAMRININNRNCTPAKANKVRIRSLMTIPIIQAILRDSYTASYQPSLITSSGDAARGAMYAASLVPQIGLCSPNDASIIYDNMKTGKSYAADYVAVRAALENNYDCLMITCSDVGGYFLANSFGGGSYYAGAEPCGVEPKRLTTGEIVGIVLGSVFGFLILSCIVLFCCLPRRPSKKRKAKLDRNPQAEAT